MNRTPTLQHAETHDHYLPKPRDPRLDETESIAEQVRAFKAKNPNQGDGIVDSLIDQLIARSIEFTHLPEHEREPAHWTPAQRVVWRSSHLPYPKRHQIVEDRSLSSDTKAFASINGGRWLVHCPFVGCNGAQYASFQDRRFWCVDCENRAVVGQWVEVVWPSNIEDIERALEVRPLHSRHWLPGETIDDLIAQNQQHLGESNE